MNRCMYTSDVPDGNIILSIKALPLTYDFFCQTPGGKLPISIPRIAPEHLAFYNIDMEYIVEPGKFEIMIGNCSRDCDLQKVVLTVK